jgi:hypothetical protein
MELQSLEIEISMELQRCPLSYKDLRYQRLEIPKS